MYNHANDKTWVVSIHWQLVSEIETQHFPSTRTVTPTTFALQISFQPEGHCHIPSRMGFNPAPSSVSKIF